MYIVNKTHVPICRTYNSRFIQMSIMPLKTSFIKEVESPHGNMHSKHLTEMYNVISSHDQSKTQ